MIFDIFTVLAGSVAGISLSGVLLLYFWRRLPNAPWLGLWGLAFVAIGAGLLLIVVRDSLPGFLGVAFGGAVALAGFNTFWVAARTFEKRKPVWWPTSVCAAFWLAAFLVPEFRDNITLKIVFGSAIMGACLGLSAWEVWRGGGEKLPSRKPIIKLLVLLGSVFGIRAILSPFISVAPFPVVGISMNSVAVAVFNGALLAATIILTMLLISLTMERIEMGQRSLALTDSMTGLSNRRLLEAQYGKKFLSRNTSLIVFDLDHFKNVNDKFGHAVGDSVICTFATTCREQFRQVDLVVRLGGEEFAVVLPRTTLAQAADAAERIRKAFAEQVIEVNNVAIACTVSAGVASVFDKQEIGLDELMMMADRALYRAKRAGRNRVFLPLITQAA